MEFLEIHKEGKTYTNELFSLYEDAFPEEEKKPAELLEQLYIEGKMEILAIVERERFIGLAINLLYQDQALLDYFAIQTEHRECGYGSKAIRELQRRFEGRKYILEIERPDADAENSMERIRRKNFYLRNGLKETHVYANVYHTDFELLTPDGELSYNMYVQFLKHVLDQKTFELIAPRELK